MQSTGRRDRRPGPVRRRGSRGADARAGGRARGHRSLMRDALSLLTTFGRRGGQLCPRPAAWFPVAGLGLGLGLGGVWWFADRLWHPMVAATIVVVVDLAVTGMLHFDGLADAADG